LMFFNLDELHVRNTDPARVRFPDPGA
jgi:hypothetical protein